MLRGLVNGPAAALGVARGRLGARRVLHHALAHAGAVDEELLPRLALGVERECAVGLVEHKGGAVLGRAVVAVGVLLGQVGEDALVLGAPGGQVHGAGGPDRHDAEDDLVRVGGAGLLGGGGAEDAGGGREGAEGKSGELHGDGWVGGGGCEGALIAKLVVEMIKIGCVKRRVVIVMIL